HKLSTIFLAAPTSTDTRLKQIAQASTGFVYAVSRTGVTGAQKNLPEDAQRLVERLRRITDLPIAIGFGISGPQQFASVGKYADAAAIGSAIVQMIEQNPQRSASCGRIYRTALNLQSSAVTKNCCKSTSPRRRGLRKSCLA